MSIVFSYDPMDIESTRREGPNIGVTAGVGTLLLFDVDKVSKAEQLAMFEALKAAVLASGVVPA